MCPSASKVQSYCDAADPYCCNGSDAATHQGYVSQIAFFLPLRDGGPSRHHLGRGEQRNRQLRLHGDTVQLLTEFYFRALSTALQRLPLSRVSSAAVRPRRALLQPLLLLRRPRRPAVQPFMASVVASDGRARRAAPRAPARPPTLIIRSACRRREDFFDSVTGQVLHDVNISEQLVNTSTSECIYVSHNQVWQYVYRALRGAIEFEIGSPM